MPKRPDTHKTVLFALEILRRIPKGRKVTASEIHQQLLSAGFERDLRTVQRQLDMLSSHFDIERDERTKPYGYRWKSGAKGFSIPLLTEQESLLLTLAEQHMRSLLPSNLMKSMNTFFETARQNLGSTSNVRLAREWLGKVRSISTSQPLLPPQIVPGVFEAVSSALYNNFWLTIEYKNVTGHISKSQVMPLGLAQQGPVLYLVCRYEGYDNERTLALHRLISSHETTLAFTRPKEFNLQKYDADGRFSFGEGKEIKLSFQIKKDFGQHLLETWLSDDQTVIVQDEYFMITATVVDSDRLDWWLNSYSNNISNIIKEGLDKI